MEDSFVTLKDDLTKKGTTLADRLSTLESTVETTMSDSENCLTALDAQDTPDAKPDNGRVLPTTFPESAANRNPPTFDLLDGNEPTPPTNTTINSCVVWACLQTQQCLPARIRHLIGFHNALNPTPLLSKTPTTTPVCPPILTLPIPTSQITISASPPF